MSGKILKTDIISEDALKVFSEIVLKFEKILAEAKKMKSGVKDSGLKKLSEDAKKTEIAFEGLKKNTKEFTSLLALEKQRAKETSDTLIATSKAASAQKKKENTDFKKDMAERVAAYKRVAATEKKLARERAVAARQAERDRQKALKGNKSLSTSFKNLAKSAGIYLLSMIGVNQAIRVFNSIVTTTKQLDSIDFAMKKVIVDNLELSATYDFLSRITKAYGAELVSTTSRYIKFIAAAKQSNLSAKVTQDIFESVTKAAGVLGLRTDELTGVYLALEQMLSKGKVTTEELRRQLGERIPGAFGIMADAIGVTIPQLDKMLKKGEILSSEALPKFAIQLEKAFGIENVKRVDTLIAAQTRLTLSWQDFVKEMEAAPIIAKGLDLIATSIEKIREAMQDGGDIIRSKENKMLSEAFLLINDAGTAEEKRAKTIELIGNLQKDQIFQSEQLKKSEEERDDIANSFSHRLFNILALSKGGAKGLEKINQTLGLTAAAPLLNAQKMVDARKQETSAISGVIKKLTEYFNTIKSQPFTPDELVSISQKTAEELNAEFVEIEGGYESAMEVIEAWWIQRLSLARGNTEELIALDRERILSNLKGGRLYNNLTEIEKANLYARLRELDDEYLQYKSDAAISELISTANDERAAIATKYTKDLVDSKNRASKRKATEVKLATELLGVEYRLQQDIIDSDKTLLSEKEAAAEKQKQLEEELQKTIRKGAVETERLKREELQNTLNFIGDSANAAFDIQQQFSDNQSQRAQDRYDRDMQLAGDSVAAQLVAKRKLEKEERKIAKRQAIAAKAQAAFNIGLSTAQSIIGIWAQVPKFDFGISAGVLTAAVAAIGAAQLAAALSAPLPQFAEGGITSTDSIVAGEKGVELGITPSGETFLTPNKASVLSGVPLGTEIIPHDETSRILAQQAINSTYNSVDMSRTNSYLRDIRDKKTDSVVYQNGYKIVTRKGYEGKFKV